MLELMLKGIAREWAAGQSLKQLKEFAASPAADVTFKWKKFQYGIWVAEGNVSPRAGLRQIGGKKNPLRVTVQGNVFTFWWGKL